MSATQLPLLIVRMRWIRHTLDLGLLALLILLGLLLYNATPQKRDAPAATQLIADLKRTIGTGKPAQMNERWVRFEQQMDSETQLWEDWATWLKKSQPRAVHCKLKARGIDDKSFAATCFGLAGKQTESTVLDPALSFPKTVFATQKHVEKNKGQPKNSTTAIAPKPHVVDGWVDTSEGRKRFDTHAKKWVAQ